MALADIAAALRAVPGAALEDTADQLTAYAEQVGGQVGPHRLTAVARVTGGPTATATIGGTPTAPWVWVNDGTSAHVIGTRSSGRRRALLLEGAAHPVTPPVLHRGARGRGAWRQVARRAAEVAPATVAAHVHEAVG